MKYLLCFLICFNVLGCATTGGVDKKLAKLVPHYPETVKGTEGLRFVYVKKGGIFDKLGFEKGDIIKEVNGELVKTPEHILELFENLREKSKLKILVQKKGDASEMINFEVSDKKKRF